MIREGYDESGRAVRSPKLCGLLMFPKFRGNDGYIFVFTAMEFRVKLIDSPEGIWNGSLMRRN